MVMKQKGKILPATTGPEPSAKRLMAGICNVGKTRKMPPPRQK